MKKKEFILVLLTLFPLLGAIHRSEAADNSAPTTPASAAVPSATPSEKSTALPPSPATLPSAPTSPSTTPSTTPTTTPSPTPPSPAAVPTSPTSSSSTEPNISQINCQYRLPSDMKVPSQNVLSNWAKKAAIQSFQYNPGSVDSELTALKSCFTEQGYKGYMDALEKSGNLAAIKAKQLTVKSNVTGDTVIQDKKDNQWKIRVPLEVTYENTEQKLVQTLNVDLLVFRQSSGALGIMQVIAVPQQKSVEPEKK